MLPQSKYAKVERERRFVLDGFPSNSDVSRVRRIVDRYIGLNLRLRVMSGANVPTVFKLTQKIHATGPGAQQGFITTMYLDEADFDLLCTLPSRPLTKTRHSVPPFGIDVFEGELCGLVLAEAEFDSIENADSIEIPFFFVREVTYDDRFTGGRLAHASRHEIASWLHEFGIRI